MVYSSTKQGVLLQFLVLLLKSTNLNFIIGEIKICIGGMNIGMDKFSIENNIHYICNSKNDLQFLNN